MWLMEIDAELWQRGSIDATVEARHPDAFACLGMHRLEPGGQLAVRAFVPGASAVSVLDSRTGKRVADLRQMDDRGCFAGTMGRRRKPFRYRLRVSEDGDWRELEDPYCFPSALDEHDLYLFAEGTHERVWQWMGAHIRDIEGVAGVLFVVWAPSASRVAVVGDFNAWDARVHAMRHHPANGVWELFIPGVRPGAFYKYQIRAADGSVLPLKADPYAFALQQPGETASVVFDCERYQWHDSRWMRERDARHTRDAPITIYEVHLGSWRRLPDENNRYLSYEELAQQLIAYVKQLQFTHIQLMPVSEYPFDGSWGYQPVGMFAPTSRFGSPDDFRRFVDLCHQAGLGVLLDWVPGHFPTDEHGLGRFDGTCLYEHEDPRKGFHQDWNTLIYNYGRNEVRSYLLSNAHFWMDQFHIDGLRVDAVASMLYLDYSRSEGEWLPNVHGGNENLEAITLLRRLNERLYANFPGGMTIAEESTAWPGVSRPTWSGGLGFGYKWNMGWMQDTLRYMSRDPLHRKHHHGELTFGLLYAFSENFVLPLSHDEVVHGKRSLLGRMPGDDWQRFANLRAYFGFMWSHPGKKLLFMGGEFAQRAEWSHDHGLDWHLLGDERHAGVQRLVRDLNALYRELPALHAADCESMGFEWIAVDDADRSIVAYLRRSGSVQGVCVVVCNFTPIPRASCRLGVPQPGYYRERLNTDSALYGGSNSGNAGGLHAEAVPSHGRSHSIALSLPPLATLIFERLES